LIEWGKEGEEGKKEEANPNLQVKTASAKAGTVKQMNADWSTSESEAGD